MTSNNETVSRQMPWASNIAKTMTSNRKKFTVTREMLTTVARHLSIKWLFVFHRFDPFVLPYTKSLNDWSLREQWILFPSTLIEIFGKQNSLFPSRPLIKCLMLLLLCRLCRYVASVNWPFLFILSIHIKPHSRPQSPRSSWSAPRNAHQEERGLWGRKWIKLSQVLFIYAEWPPALGWKLIKSVQ